MDKNCCQNTYIRRNEVILASKIFGIIGFLKANSKILENRWKILAKPDVILK